MTVKSILFGTAIVLAATAGSVQAGDALSTLAEVPAVKMTSDQMAKVRGGNHVIRLIMLKTGLSSLPTDAAIAATTVAGSIGGVGQDGPKIDGLLRQ